MLSKIQCLGSIRPKTVLLCDLDWTRIQVKMIGVPSLASLRGATGIAKLSSYWLSSAVNGTIIITCAVNTAVWSPY